MVRATVLNCQYTMSLIALFKHQVIKCLYVLIEWLFFSSDWPPSHMAKARETRKQE